MTLPFERITLAQVAAFPRPGTVAPASLAFTPDGGGLTYLFSAEGTLVRSLWRYDLATGERTVLAGPDGAGTSGLRLSRDEELRRERLRLRELGVTDYQWAPKADQPVLLVPGAHGLQVRLGDGELREVAGTAGAVDPRLSDDGRRLAFVRDGDLSAVDITEPGSVPRRLTTTAEDGLTNGLAEFIAQEELDQPRGFWWAPGARRIAFVEADSRHIRKYPIVHQGRDHPETEEHRYPFAGEANARLRLGVADVDSADGGTTTWMDLGPDPDIYLARVAWTPAGGLTAQLLSRDQKSLRLVAFNSETGSMRVLIDERCEPWLNLHDHARFLESGDILWSNEQTGFRHLFLHDATGRPLRQLTSGDWMVTRVAGVDEPRRVVYFIGTREGALERHLYAVSLDGDGPRRLTEEPGWHDCTVSRDGDHFVDVHSALDRGVSVTLRDQDGAAQAVIHADAGATAAALGLRPPELFTLAASDGTSLDGALYTPPVIEPGRRYPLVVSVYGGPHAQRVANEWSLTIDLRAQYLAQEGYVVARVDNRGAAGRGLTFESHIAGNLGAAEVEDQVAAVDFLAQRPYVDRGRVGVYGWSYGGYMTCLMLMKAPGVFSVGVAGAPVTHWDGYDTGYTERYLGTPAANPEAYRESSVLAHVEGLAGKLLLVHGGVDENVHFRHTARLIVALTSAQKSYDLVIFPEERHMPRDARGLEYMERRLVEYFRAHL